MGNSVQRPRRICRSIRVQRECRRHAIHEVVKVLKIELHQQIRPRMNVHCSAQQIALYTLIRDVSCAVLLHSVDTITKDSALAKRAAGVDMNVAVCPGIVSGDDTEVWCCSGTLQYIVDISAHAVDSVEKTIRTGEQFDPVFVVQHHHEVGTARSANQTVVADDAAIGELGDRKTAYVLKRISGAVLLRNDVRDFRDNLEEVLRLPSLQVVDQAAVHRGQRIG